MSKKTAFSSDGLDGCVLNEKETIEFKAKAVRHCFIEASNGAITAWTHRDGRILIDSVHLIRGGG